MINDYRTRINNGIIPVSRRDSGPWEFSDTSDPTSVVGDRKRASEPGILTELDLLCYGAGPADQNMIIELSPNAGILLQATTQSSCGTDMIPFYYWRQWILRSIGTQFAISMAISYLVTSN